MVLPDLKPGLVTAAEVLGDLAWGSQQKALVSPLLKTLQVPCHLGEWLLDAMQGVLRLQGPHFCWGLHRIVLLLYEEGPKAPEYSGL